jgi:hypothetical protein
MGVPALSPLSVVGLVFTGVPLPGATLTANATGFAPGETINCAVTGTSTSGSTIPPAVVSFAAGAGGALRGPFLVPPAVAAGSTVLVGCIGATS